MPKITVSNLQHPHLHQDLQTNLIRVELPSRIDLNIDKNEIAQMEQVGKNLIITLKNGEKITIQQFFTPEQHTPHQLLLRDQQGNEVQANFDEYAQLLDYSPVRSVQVTAPSSPDLSVTTAPLNADPQLGTLSATETEEDGQPLLMKIGLGILVADAAYLLLNKKDKNNSDNNHAGPPDLTPPTISAGTLDPDGKVITGQTEANIRIYVTNQAGKTIGESTSDAEGRFKIVLSEVITDGALISMKAVDQAGNESKAVILKGSKDTIAPAEANAQINDQGLIISGKAEALSKIYIYDATGKTQIAGPVYTAKDGSFSVTLKTALQHGTKAMVMVQDEAGNQSKMVSVEVGKDTLAPEQPLIEVTQDGRTIKGTAEALSKISILSENGQVLATGQADANGKFQLNLQPALAKDQTANIVLEDAAGNKSPALKFKAGQDNIAPDKAIATINADGTVITGTAEANATIEIYNQQGNKIGSSTVSADGKFSVTLTTSIVNGNLAKVYVLDHASNKSIALDLIGNKDTIAPNKVLLKNVNDQVGETKGEIKAGDNSDDPRPVFNGTGEPNATLTVYNHGIAIGSVQVDNKGTWSFKPAADLALGKQNFTFTQMDAGSNTSEMSDSFQFNVIPPSTTSSNLLMNHDHPVHQFQAQTNISIDELLFDKPTAPETVFSKNISSSQFDSTTTSPDLLQLLQPITTYIA